MKHFRFFLLCLGIFAASTFAQAHFLWVVLNPTSHSFTVGLQEQPSLDPLPLGERNKLVKAWAGGAKFLSLKVEGNHLSGQTKQDCIAASLDYGVLDLRKAGRGLFWLKYNAKAAATPAASQHVLGLPVELTLKKAPDGTNVVTVLRLRKPVASAEIHIDCQGGKADFDGKTGADGTLKLPKGTSTVAIRALITETTPGTHGGKAYDLVRSYSTLTIGNVKLAKPLTQLLRESFGNDHDVVERTEFVKTLKAGKLTKAQLESHLQQRALIHTAVDDILRAAKPPAYGDAEKNVLELLQSDVSKMGSTWPIDSQGWPLTNRLLDEIRESAKRGPYFALGVFHVYFGGITHGGRDIAAKIQDILHIRLSYYLDSDGYDAYASQVNRITDGDEQKEVIRGGNAAYQYIIKVNNSDEFKSGH